MNKAIDIEGLKRFKAKQDTFNEEKFVQSADYVDGDGIIKTEKLPPGVSEVVLIHVVDENGTTKYYTDNNGVKTSTEVTGVAGKIYIDLESASKNMYVYDANTGEFANFVANVASSADIDSLFD